MLITIYDVNGQKRTQVNADDNSTQTKEIQGDNVLSVSFTLYEFVALDVNDYVDFKGERYWLMEKYHPTQKSSVEWTYDLKLYGVESLLKRFLVLKTVDGEDEPVFTLTAPPREHLALIVQAINDGMGGITDYKVGAVTGTENVVMDYEGTYCDEALKRLAEKVGAEWWMEGQTLNLSRCEHGEEITLGYRKGLVGGIEKDMADNYKFYTRLFPIGSNKNIDREVYGHSRLQLPGGAKYVDVNVDKYGVIHHYEADAFADIYPRRTGTVSSWRSEERQDSDGNGYKVYYFKDDTLDFDPNGYEIGGLVKRVSFQEGSELAGLGNEEDGSYFFEVNYDSETREFEIITIWPYGDEMQLPNDTLHPGGNYVLWNIKMPEEYYAQAEAELLTVVKEYNKAHGRDAARYKASTDHVYVEEQKVELFLGRRVRLESKEYFPETGYRSSRITKITRKVNLPEQMDLEISDAVSTGAMAKIGSEITDVKSYAKSLAGSASLPDIIRCGDSTTPTDNNLFSARRSKQEFLNKNEDDRVKGNVTFEKDISVIGCSSVGGDHTVGGDQTVGGKQVVGKEGDADLGEIVQEVMGRQSLHGGFETPNFNDAGGQITGARLRGDGRLSVASIEANSFSIQELIYNVIRAQGGEYAYSDAATVESCRYVLVGGDIILPDDYYHGGMTLGDIDHVELTIKKMEENKNAVPFKHGDILYGHVNSMPEDGQRFVGGTCLMYVLSKDEDINKDGSMVIKAQLFGIGQYGLTSNIPPTAGMTLAHRGTVTGNKERMTSFFIDTHNANLVMFQGVQSPVLSKEHYALINGKLPHDLYEMVREKFSILKEDDPVSYAKYGIFQNIIEFDHLGGIIQKPKNRGEWDENIAKNRDYTKRYKNTETYYDEVTCDGSLWKCLESDNEERPSLSNPAWLRLVAKGDDTSSVSFSLVPNVNTIYIHDKQGSSTDYIDIKVLKSSTGGFQTITSNDDLDTYGLKVQYSLDGEDSGRTDLTLQSSSALVMDDGIELITEDNSLSINLESSVIDLLQVKDNITFYLVDTETEEDIDVRVIPVLRDGVSTAYIDVFNDADDFGVTHDGTTVLEDTTLKTELSLWYGGERLTIKDVEVSINSDKSCIEFNDDLSYNNDKTSVAVTMKVEKGASVPQKNNLATITLTSEVVPSLGYSITKSASFIATASPVGAEGESYESYDMVFSHKQIKKNKDGKISPSTIVVSLTKTIGKVTENTSEGILRYWFDEGQQTELTGNPSYEIELSNDVERVYFEYHVNGERKDNEDFSVIFDGTDGENGINGIDSSDTDYIYALYASNDVDAYEKLLESASNVPAPLEEQRTEDGITWHDDPMDVTEDMPYRFQAVAHLERGAAEWGEYGSITLDGEYVEQPYSIILSPSSVSRNVDADEKNNGKTLQEFEVTHSIKIMRGDKVIEDIRNVRYNYGTITTLNANARYSIDLKPQGGGSDIEMISQSSNSVDLKYKAGSAQGACTKSIVVDVLDHKKNAASVASATITINYSQRGWVGGDGASIYPYGFWDVNAIDEDDSDYAYKLIRNQKGNVVGRPAVYYKNICLTLQQDIKRTENTEENLANAYYWYASQKVKLVWAEGVLADFAHFGNENGAVFAKHYLFSQMGKDDQGNASAYYYTYKDGMFDENDNLKSVFTPNLFLDLKAGAIKAARISEPFIPMEAGIYAHVIDTKGGHNLTIRSEKGINDESKPKIVFLPEVADGDPYYDGLRCSIIAEAMPNVDIKAGHSWDDSKSSIGCNTILVCADGSLATRTEQVEGLMHDGMFCVGGRMAKFIAMEAGSMLQLRCNMTKMRDYYTNEIVIRPIWYVENSSDFEPTKIKVEVYGVHTFLCKYLGWYPQGTYIAMATKYIESVRNGSDKMLSFTYFNGESPDDVSDFQFNGIE